jgi:hypothetical protein
MNHRKNVNHPFLFGGHRSRDRCHLGTAHPQFTLVRASGKFALLDRMLQSLHTDSHQIFQSNDECLVNVMEGVNSATGNTVELTDQRAVRQQQMGHL